MTQPSPDGAAGESKSAVGGDGRPPSRRRGRPVLDAPGPTQRDLRIEPTVGRTRRTTTTRT